MDERECLTGQEWESPSADQVMQIDVRHLLHLMAGREASDLHIRAGSSPILRVDGTLVPAADVPPLSPEAIHNAFEQITTEEQRRAFYANRELDFSYSVHRLARFRVNAFFQRGTVGLAVRRVPIHIPSIEELGLPQVCKTLALNAKGLVLVTGPGGCGKSTTLAAMIDYINCHQTRNIITIENPIEFLHRNRCSVIAQRELGDDTLSAAAALRQALRQDPDVIVVSEMSDLDTVATLISAAENGHLVLGTLRANDVTQAVERIVDAFPPSQQGRIRLQLSTALQGIIAQMLLPRAEGQGRVVACEVMTASDEVRALIREGRIYHLHSFMQTCGERGIQTFESSLWELVVSGQISGEEALIRSSRPDEFRPPPASYLGTAASGPQWRREDCMMRYPSTREEEVTI